MLVAKGSVFSKIIFVYTFLCLLVHAYATSSLNYFGSILNVISSLIGKFK